MQTPSYFIEAEKELEAILNDETIQLPSEVGDRINNVLSCLQEVREVMDFEDEEEE